MKGLLRNPATDHCVLPKQCPSFPSLKPPQLPPNPAKDSCSSDSSSSEKDCSSPESSSSSEENSSKSRKTNDDSTNSSESSSSSSESSGSEEDSKSHHHPKSPSAERGCHRPSEVFSKCASRCREPKCPSILNLRIVCTQVGSFN